MALEDGKTNAKRRWAEAGRFPSRVGVNGSVIATCSCHAELGPKEGSGGVPELFIR